MKNISALCLLLCLVFRAFAGTHYSHDGKNNDCSANITVNVSWSSICPGSSVTITASGGATYLWNDGETTATISVSPAYSTLYIVTGTDTGGCTGTATSEVNVDNFTVYENYSYASTCDGLPIVFSSSIVGGITPFTYYWKADGSNGAGDTITNYSSSAYDYGLWVTDSLGCQSISSSPYIPRYEFYAYLPDSAQYCNDYGDPKANTLFPTIVEGMGPYTFNWNTGDTTAVINPNAPGLYSLILTDGYGCSQTFNCHVTFPLAPVVTVTASSNNILPGSYDTLTASGAEKYYWSNGMTGNRIIIHLTHSSDYSVYGWDTISGPITTLRSSVTEHSTINGCGSPWQSIPIVVFTDPWRPSLSTPFTYTSPIYTLGDVGIGLQVPTKALQVNGSAIISDTLTVPVVAAHRIALYPGDSLIHLGDSSFVFNLTNNNIYNSTSICITCPATYNGIALGTGNSMRGRSSFVTPSIAIGSFNSLNSTSMSIAMGYYNSNQANNTITIGGSLTNNIQGAIMLGGYNSTGNIPALSIIPDMTNGTPGFVGIGTITPVCPFDVNASGTSTAGRVANFSNSSSSVFITSKMPTPSDWNPLVQADDNGIFWDDGSGGGNHNSGFVIAPHSSSSQGIRVDASGNVGIGTGAPDAMLDIYPANASALLPFAVQSKDAPYPDAVYIDPWGNGYFHGYVEITGGSGSYIDDATLLLHNNYGYALSVTGTIWSSEIKVCATYGGCDFVFDKDYKLMPLKDLEEYLNLNHHLPGIPSAKEMEDNNGIELGKMNTQLLQKVEELTLYTIQLKKQ